MNRSIKWLVAAMLILLLLIGYWFFYLRDARENKLITEGNNIVHKTDEYHARYGKLPSSLSDMGIVEIDESNPPLYYEKRDSFHYTLSFILSMDKSKIYYSDSKKWEEVYREMK